ncbi:MAG: T9SS type A sorting domain-containing protein, partial [Pigmentiphaga sp.]|nr:T9SS type A sorting domain-containing protein [Pigmentiphaga sp.]
FAGEKLFVVNGGGWSSQENRPGKVMIYENGTWTNITSQDFDPIIKQEVPSVDALDFMNVAVDSKDNSHFFVTSYGTGLYEFKNDEFFAWYHHRKAGVTLENPEEKNPANPNYQYVRLDGAVFDQEENLYLANMAVLSPIKIFSKDGVWSEIDFSTLPSKVYTVGKIIISNQNQYQKWAPSKRYNPGILIWDDSEATVKNSARNTLQLPANHMAFLSSFDDVDNPGGKITPTYFYCIEQDKNGVMWVGTDMGPLLFYNPSKVFDPGYTCSRVKIPRNDGTDLADYLLQNEEVKAIAIDGANRKWLGTGGSGLYLMSENGQETIHHFTSANSPLLSDDILSLALNPVSGELFIGTGNGLISFQTDAAESNNVYTDVYAYPNPVRENYNGVITIVGLINKTQVKITDLNGNLIYQTISNGSIATWDGKDFHGRKVNTGIYFAVCANEDGTQSTITKIMVIN